MRQSLQWIDNSERPIPEAPPSRRLPFVKFLLRYPIFILAFGPPMFRTGSVDATKGILDFWSLLQVGLLSAVASRAIWRLVAAQTIFLPKQIRSVLRWGFLLGFLYLASTEYSPSRFASAAYAIVYFLTLFCAAEFVVDAYRDPPDWMQCIFYLRRISFLLLALDFVILPIDPKLVVGIVEGVGIRFGGGLIGPVLLICPVIAIISAYSFLYSLEGKVRSAFFFFVGLVLSLSFQSRGCEIALFISLFILALQWAKSSRRALYHFIPGFIALFFLSLLFAGAMGAGRIWSIFNRGQNAAGIASASGRTDIWKFVIHYCMNHPQGMGYVAGFRMIFRNYVAVGLQVDVSHIGNAHNAYFQVLADAGWLALAVYLIMLSKILWLAWRFRKKRSYRRRPPESESIMALECSLILFIFLLTQGMDTSGFSVPLSMTSYWYYIIIAIILGISARMIAASRARSIVSFE
jgi:O-antigen ligase